MENYWWLIIIGIIINGIIFAAFCNDLAIKKGYEKTGGYLMAGFFFGIIALIYVNGLPDIKLREMMQILGTRYESGNNF